MQKETLSFLVPTPCGQKWNFPPNAPAYGAVATAGLAPSGFSRPLCAAPKEGFCFAGVQTEARVANLTWIGDRGILVASDPDAHCHKFCKYKHNDIVSTVSVPSSGTQAVNLARQKVRNSYQDNRILLEDICCPKPASQMGHGSLSLVIRMGLSSYGHLSASCALSSVVQSWCITGPVFSPHTHRNFVRNAAWSALNHSLLTTVVRDREVLHHFMPTEPLPEPDLRVLLSRLDFRQEANPPRVSTPFAPALSLCETTQEPYTVCQYTKSVQLVGIVSQAGGGWILKSYSQGRTMS
ncbi:hypothetical protein AB1E18_003414 [Capra hircus]